MCVTSANKKISNEEIKKSLEILIKHYKNIYERGNEPHYYPAINLAYMLKIYEFLFSKKMFKYDINKLYKECKNSIDKDRKNKKLSYYAWISEIEFKMLMGKRIKEEMYLMLEELHPSQFLIDRSLRQVNFFKKLINHCQKEVKNLPEFTDIIKILGEYHKIIL